MNRQLWAYEAKNPSPDTQSVRICDEIVRAITDWACPKWRAVE